MFTIHIFNLQEYSTFYFEKVLSLGALVSITSTVP